MRDIPFRCPVSTGNLIDWNSNACGRQHVNSFLWYHIHITGDHSLQNDRLSHDMHTQTICLIIPIQESSNCLVQDAAETIHLCGLDTCHGLKR